MTLEITATAKYYNTQYGPLAALLTLYQKQNRLKPLKTVTIGMKTRDFSPQSKLEQLLISILTGCETISLVNTRLRPEVKLAQIWGLSEFATQSTLSRTLDGLSLMNIEQLQAASGQICQKTSRTQHHDWRGHLWLDYDLSGLPCAAKAQASQKGYFSGKKTGRVVN